MKIEGEIVEIPPTCTNTEPRKYRLSITGVGTHQECNLTMEMLFKDKPSPSKVNDKVKEDTS